MPTSTADARATRKAAPLFAALGDETRLALVVRLCTEGPGSIAKLSERAHVTRQAITKHLSVLEEAGLVRSERRGRESVWAFEPKRLDEAHLFLERISTGWDDALERLRQHVEE